MKAVVIHATGGPEQLTVADMPDPVPGPGEVLLDVAYAGCNWADTQVRMGIYPHAMTYPMVLGFEVSGMVAALGPGVTGVKVGDKVASFPEKGGAYAEKCVAPAVGLIKLPSGVGLDVGAAFALAGFGDEVDHGLDGNAAGDFAGVVAAHAVGEDP